MSERQVEDVPLRDRIAENPRPALLWALGLLALFALEFGAFLQVLVEIVGTFVSLIPGEFGVAAVTSMQEAVAGIPTLLTRDLIPNQGWRAMEGGELVWKGAFMGLEPKHAWLLRVVLIYAYAFAFLYWCWRGFLVYREHYRFADWTPRDDVVDRLRSHAWGKFGLTIVVMFVTMALFAPALGPTTVDENILNPYSHNTKYWDVESEEVKEVPVGIANLGSTSKGPGSNNVGPWTYDAFDRFHPFGTLTTGKDLFTFMAQGARVSLAIALTSMFLAGLIALALAMVTAYYKGLVDLLTVVTSDSVQSLPVFMVLILGAVVFSGTWIAEQYDGALLLTAIFVLIYWPFLWRAVRGPAFQTSEQEWIDAAKSFGQKPRVIMQKHMAPYIIGYMLIYTSMSLGGIIISVSGLSFLGLGINPPTPEWGRAISEGQPYVATISWHISLIPGIMITLVVTAFNALGDGIRDAIDPQSKGAEAGTEAAAAGGGGA